MPSARSLNDAPVLIAGGGPVGLGVALALARWGRRSIVFEKRTPQEREPRSAVILPRSLEIFRAWSVHAAVSAAGIVEPRLRITDARNERRLLEIDFSAFSALTLDPAPRFLSQDALVALLRERALAGGACTLLDRHDVTAVDQDAFGVRVTARTPLGERTFSGSFAVGADGAQSTVRAALGLHLEGETYPWSAGVAVVRLPAECDRLPWPRVRLDGHRYLAALRSEDRRWRIVTSLEGTGAPPSFARAEIDAALHRLFGATRYDLEWAGAFRVHRRRAPYFVRGRIALAGDAAHLNSPAGAQGMNSGLEDAHNLGWKLAGALAGGDASRLLASYDCERRAALARSVEPFADRLTRVALAAGPSLRRAALLAGALGLRISPIARRAYRRATLLDADYSGSPLCRGAAGVVGRRPPDAVLASSAAPALVLAGIDSSAARPLIGSLPFSPAIVELDPTAAARWRLRPPFAAFVRPDGYVGWAQKEPPPGAIADGVFEALGFPSGAGEPRP